MIMVSKAELQEFNKEKRSKPLGDWVLEFRSKPKSDRDIVIDELTAKGIEFKGNAKTSDLKLLLEESK